MCPLPRAVESKRGVVSTDPPLRIMPVDTTPDFGSLSTISTNFPTHQYRIFREIRCIWSVTNVCFRYFSCFSRFDNVLGHCLWYFGISLMFFPEIPKQSRKGPTVPSGTRCLAGLSHLPELSPPLVTQSSGELLWSLCLEGRFSGMPQEDFNKE